MHQQCSGPRLGKSVPADSSRREAGLERLQQRLQQSSGSRVALEWLTARASLVARCSSQPPSPQRAARACGRAVESKRHSSERHGRFLAPPGDPTQGGRTHARTHTRVNDMPPRPAAAGCSPCLRRDAAGCRCSSCTETEVGERTCQSAVVRLVVVVVVVVVFGSWVLRSSAVESSQRHQSRQRVRGREWYASRHGSGRGAGPVFWTVGGRACTVPGEGPGVRGGE